MIMNSICWNRTCFSYRKLIIQSSFSTRTPSISTSFYSSISNDYSKSHGQKKLSLSLVRENHSSISPSEKSVPPVPEAPLSSSEGNKSPGAIYNQPVAKTGAFIKTWPMVYEAKVHYKRAYRETMKTIKPDPTIKNVRLQQRKYAARFIDSLMQSLTKPITQNLNLYSKRFKNLHPFEATVANLTVIARAKRGLPELKDVLQNLKNLRTLTGLTAKEYAKLCKNATTTETKELISKAMEDLELLYNTTTPETQALTDLMRIHQDLRRIPVIDLHLPTIVLVGAPNVGKSSIVRAVSTGTPEVNDYPFTTRGVTIGHILDNDYDTSPKQDTLISTEEYNRRAGMYKFQVMDTPGLLDRPEEERNEMERLTFASLLHLPTAVIFVIDPTGTAGEHSPLRAQLNIRKYLKGRFPKRPWMDVISKGDVPITSEALQLLKEYGLIPYDPEGKRKEIWNNWDRMKKEDDQKEKEKEVRKGGRKLVGRGILRNFTRKPSTKPAGPSDADQNPKAIEEHEKEEKKEIPENKGRGEEEGKELTRALVISVKSEKNMPFLKNRVMIALRHLREILLALPPSPHEQRRNEEDEDDEDDDDDDDDEDADDRRESRRR